jgi:hypothetical protein
MCTRVNFAVSVWRARLFHLPLWSLPVVSDVLGVWCFRSSRASARSFGGSFGADQRKTDPMTARQIKSPLGGTDEHDARHAEINCRTHGGVLRAARMGKLMALSLACTLAAAVLFQPVLMGPPRGSASRASQAGRDIDATAGAVSAAETITAGSLSLDAEDALDRKAR